MRALPQADALKSAKSDDSVEKSCKIVGEFSRAGGCVSDTRLDVQQRNEQVRTLIAPLSNGGLALFGGFSAVLYSGNGGDDALAMAILGVFLISGSFAASVLLREEA